MQHLIPVDSHHIFLEKRGKILVLWYLREHGTVTAQELQNGLLGRQTTNAVSVHLIHALMELNRIGLIELDGLSYDETGYPNLHKIDTVKVFVNPKLYDLQSLFQIKLSELIEDKPISTEKLSIFGVPLPYKDNVWSDVFVLMPFTEELTSIYEKHILPLTEDLGLSCKRGDDFFSTRSIIDEIWSAIVHCKICIADCTNRNPNVFYEIGIAHTLGKPVILIAQSIDDVPFDIRHRRVIIYRNNLQGLQEFKQTLRQVLMIEL